MCPVLFHVGPFTVYSYGLMVAIAFVLASWTFSIELRRRKIDQNLAGTLTLIALVGGIVGAKGLYLIEEWDAFMKDPAGMAFSPGGLTFYGGLVLATIACVAYLKQKKYPLAPLLDAVAPSLILGYGIGRIGCQLAGDGDYGILSDLPWAMGYPNGVVPTPPGVRVHPTPVYETIACLIIFAYLWGTRKKPRKPGTLFLIYLVLAGLERLLVEFIRLNPKLALGLTEAQWISVVMIIIGAAGLYRFRQAPPAIAKSRKE